MQANVVRELRAAGFPMLSRHMGAQIAWTTDPEKAEKARVLGAEIRPYRSPRPDACGWEIVARPDPPPEVDDE